MRRIYITAVFASITNMIIFWHMTTWDILAVIFMAFVCCILEIWICSMAKAFLQQYILWQQAEQMRIEQAAARQRRRRNYKNYDLRQTEEDEWYEVPLNQAM